MDEATLRIFVILGGVVLVNAELGTDAIAQATRRLAKGSRGKGATNNCQEKKETNSMYL